MSLAKVYIFFLCSPPLTRWIGGIVGVHGLVIVALDTR
jgi:hypothetical protein